MVVRPQDEAVLMLSSELPEVEVADGAEAMYDGARWWLRSLVA